MSAKNSSADREDTRKELLRYLLQQVQEKKLAKEQALEYVKLFEPSKDAKINEPVAIVGMACRFPDAENKDEFWRNLVDGRNCLREFPEQRTQDVLSMTDEDMPFFTGGFLDKVDQFDPEFFGISPHTALHMDPYQRLMLEVLVESIEDAGYSSSAFYNKPVGVFIGNDHAHRYANNYLDFIDFSQRDFNSMTGSWTGLLAGRLSYILNLRGPAQVIDTSCSSALVALDSALKSLANDDCDTALVGAINLVYLPLKNVIGEVENDEPIVCTFDDRAKGTVWGEGAAAVLIKPLSKAQRDGDDIYGIVKGVAVNSDGASNGITAPSSKAQQQVLLKSWERAGVNPEDISYIEAHGTGTHLGDPIEIKGLMDAFGKFTQRKQFCGLGSVKTNIGHTVAASGLASMIKVLMSFKHRQLAPSINFQRPNEYIDFCNSPVYINDSLRPWESDGVRTAGVSSFGLVGTNAHVVLQEFEAAPKSEDSTQENIIFPISARNSALMAETVERYLAFLNNARSNDETINLIDLSYTLALGRTHHPVRAVIVARDVEELSSRLQKYAVSLRSQIATSSIEGVIIGTSVDQKIKQLKPIEISRLANEIIVNGWPNSQALTQEFSEYYVAGAQVKWAKLFEELKPRRVHLPAQPFQRQRFWFDSQTKTGQKAAKLTLTDLTNEAQSSDPRDMFIVARQGECITREQGEEFTASQSVVAYVVSDTLGYKSVKMADSFYALGGDSISGARISYIINEMLGIKSELSDLLATDTLGEFVNTLDEHRGLAAAIQRMESGDQADAVSAPTIAQVPEAENYVLSRAQRRMFLQAQLDPNSTTYNATALIEVAGKPDASQETKVLQQLVDRHESLRTSFTVVDDEPVQHIHSKLEFKPVFLKVDASGSLGSGLQEQLQKIIEEQVVPFELEKAPLLRVIFIETSDDQHFMLIDMHHIMTDGASVGIFIREHMALKQGQALPPLPINYRDFAAWDVEQAKSDDYQNLSKHWLKRFEGEIPVAQLDTDFPRPANRDFRGSTLHLELKAQQLSSLKALARQQGCSLFVVLTAAFRVLLSKYGAGEDLPIGTPVSGRYQHQVNDIIGMFVNTLVLRDKIDTSATFSELLTQIKTNTLEDFDHKDFAYEDLIEVLDQRHVPDRNPLFDICFVLQNQDMGLSTEGALQDVAFESGISKFDLTVLCRENGDILEVNWEYATALFKRARVARLAEHFEALLDQVVQQPTATISELNLISSDQHKYLLEKLNNNQIDSKRSSIPALISEQAKKQANATAVVHYGNKISYGELEQASNQLAHYLLAQGVKPNQPVALWFAPRIEMVVAVLAVLKAGAMYVPLDIANPQERIESILNDCKADVLLTHSAESSIAIGAMTKICVDQVDLSNYENTLPDITLNGDDTAYLMYTSGTTGVPKGALIRHKSIIRAVHNTNYLHLDSSDVCMLLSNYAFDGCVFDLYGSLLNGGQLVLVDKTDVVDSGRVAEIVAGYKVTSAFATTSLFNMLIDQQLDALCHMKYLIFGGEVASNKHCYKALQAFGPGHLVNVYGPTECTVLVTANVIDHLEPDGSVSIGKEINDTQLYILDEHKKLVPFGCTGELYVGGIGVSLGYLNRDELNAERFVDDPFHPGEKLYKTGDLIRWQDDGSLHYVGRIDNQVKIRGFRIELGEIENALSALPTVKQAFVTDFKQDDRKFIAAYIVLEDDSKEVKNSQIRTALEETLPEYMIPDSMMLLEEMPLNINGKVNRQKLPEPEFNNQENYVAPTNELEEELCGIWKELLGVEQVGVHDNFFRIGGDSIVCIQLVTRLRQVGFNLQVKDVFTAPTVAQLARWLSMAPKGPEIDAEQGALEGEFNLLPVQNWFFDLSLNKPNHFNQAFMVQVPNGLEEQAIANALQKLAEQHDMLRVDFAKNESGYLQSYRANADKTMAPLRTLSVAGLDAEQIQAHLNSVQSSFDFERGPLWQVLHLTDYAGNSAQENTARLFFCFHHLIIDAVSWRIVAEDIARLINGDELSQKTSSYRQWSQALVEYGQNNAAEANYWRDVCPQQQPSLLAVTDTAERETLYIDEVRTNKLLREANQGYRTEINDLLLSAMAIALAETFDTDKNHIILEGHGREPIVENLDVSHTLGWFTVRYPVALSAHSDIGECIIATKEMLRKIPNKGIGYGVFKQNGDLAGTAEPVVSFNYLGQLNQDSENSNWQMTDDECGITVAPENNVGALLDINGAVKHGKMAFFVDSKLSKAVTDKFIDCFSRALDRVVAQGIYMAEQGGEATPSDFAVDSLSFSRLQKIQSKMTEEAPSNNPGSGSKAKKKKMKI